MSGSEQSKKKMFFPEEFLLTENTYLHILIYKHECNRVVILLFGCFESDPVCVECLITLMSISEGKNKGREGRAKVKGSEKAAVSYTFVSRSCEINKYMLM